MYINNLSQERSMSNPSPRRTKIIATLGPKTDDPKVMCQLIQAGMNIVRINMSHGQVAEQLQRVALAQRCALELGKVIGILIDLQGPKIRIAAFKSGIIELVEGASFVLDAALAKDAGTIAAVGLDYQDLPEQVVIGDELLLDDGRIVLSVRSIEGTKITTQVIVGGELSSQKGLNRRGGGLSATALTEKDQQDLASVAHLAIDYVALSFPKSAQDVLNARQLMDKVGLKAHLVAKIERSEAVTAIAEILQVADAIMVARGDLGVEIGYAQLPGVQKYLIKQAEEADKAVITATQMMESMIYQPLPTRAEVSDVANAIIDGTDAVMLSAETATGNYPVKVVGAIDEICMAAEQQKITQVSRHRLQTRFTRHDQAIAMAAMYLANHVTIKAIVALTESGSTPLWMSRIHSGIPIYALSRHPQTCGRVTLYRGVYPVAFDATQFNAWEVTSAAIKLLMEQGILTLGDKVIVTKGNIIGVGGGANNLKIVTATAVNQS